MSEVKIDLEGMRRRAEEGTTLAGKATAGPWRNTWDEPHHPTFDESVAVTSDAPETTLDPPERMIVGTMWYDGLNIACRKVDANFIADARARVPDLAADVLALCAEVERLRADARASAKGFV